MLSTLASGTLIADPRRRTSATGKDYGTAALRVPVEDGEALIASLICFDEHAVTALLALAKGDACAVAGRAKLSTWEKNGEQRHGLSVTVDRVLTVYAAGKMRRKAARELEDEEQPA